MTSPSDATRETATEFLTHCRRIVDARLDTLLPAGSVEPANVHKAIRWSLFAGGKRFRPALVLATGKVFGASLDILIDTACAFEMIHTYSLIHDDLPSMDDDALRRGMPTCHVEFGEATAILAGDALQALAFETVAKDEKLNARTRVRVIAEISSAAGTPEGMVAGQAFDLSAESNHIDEIALEKIHNHKTGALIAAAARCGAMIAEVADGEIESITRYGRQLGLLFQVTDDLLDVTGEPGALGKTPGKDARAQKATYPSIFGYEGARKRALAVHASACESLSGLKVRADLLSAIADFILERKT